MNSLSDVKIAKVAIAYDCAYTHQTYILVFDYVLYIPSLEVNLLCVDQLRDYGIIVNDTPLIRLPVEQRAPTSHSILAPQSDLHIPLLFEKPISFFHCRKPTYDECSTEDNFVQMTSSVPWEPYDEDSHNAEETLRQQYIGDTAYRWLNSLSSVPDPRYRSLDNEVLATILGDKVQATLAAVQTSGKNSLIKPDQLARRWRCSIECARRTLAKTTQRAVRDWTNVTGSRRFRPTQFQLEYPRIRCDVHVDVKKGPCKSVDGNTYVAVYATSFQWARAYGLRNESEVSNSLKNLFRDFGFPRVLRPDHAESLIAGEFRRVANKAQVPIHPHEPYRPDQNLAEDCIREGTRMYHRFMSSRSIPKAFWDRVFIYCLELRSHMVLGHPLQGGECGATIISGNTRDISHLTDFSIWDWCWALSPTNSKQDNKQLCRWLGPSFDVGADLCYACATARGKIIHRTSVIPLSTEERTSENIKELKKRFMEDLERNLPTGRSETIDPENEPSSIDQVYMRPIAEVDEDETPQFELYEDDHVDPEDEPMELAPPEETEPVEFDRYVGAKIREVTEAGNRFGVVKGRKRDRESGNFIGTYHENQFVDTSLYDVEWDDGSTDAYRANQIVEAMMSNVDADGNTLIHLKEIIDHRRNGHAVYGDDAYIWVNGRKKPRRTTKGWQLCLELHGGGTEWVDLKIAKESYPIEVAEYAVANKLVSEPAFSWWVPMTLRKRDRVLKAVKSRALTRKNEKFGLEVPGPGPNGVRRAYEIDTETQTTFWSEAMKKEVKTVLPALKVLEENESVPPGYTQIDLMTVFDVKMDLTRKARICARGDQTDPPLSVTYASVVSRDTIRIGLMLAALNGLKVCSADIAGAYLNAPCAEKIYTVLGPEFGDLAGRTAIVAKALYGLKSSGFSWRSTLSTTLRESLEFVQCQGDMDCWRRPAEKSNGEKYYEYLFVYVDDVIAISENPEAILKKLNEFYTLKPESIKEPKTFLGATISKVHLDGTTHGDTWAIGSSDYLAEALRVVKQRISHKKYNLRLKTKVSATLPSGYKPELDATEYCDADTVALYMHFIGVLRWLVELGRIDIAGEVSMMSSYSAMPRTGHFHAVLHMFAYLQNNPDWEIAMDPTVKDWNPIEKKNWKEFYPWAKDEKPKGMPVPLGKPVQLTMFVDASHAANVVTRQSRTGVIIFVNSAPVIWYSKKQNSVETSSFGSEFMALKTGVELLEGLRYKLRMMGVPLEGYCYTFVDNKSVVHNTSLPESTLKKKSNSVAYNYCRSVAAADVYRVDWVDTKENWADMLTKIQSGPERHRLRCGVMYAGDPERKKETKLKIQVLNAMYD